MIKKKLHVVNEVIRKRDTKHLYNLIKYHDISKYVDTKNKDKLSKKLKRDKELCSLFKEKYKDKELLNLI